MPKVKKCRRFLLTFHHIRRILIGCPHHLAEHRQQYHENSDATQHHIHAYTDRHPIRILLQPSGYHPIEEREGHYRRYADQPTVLAEKQFHHLAGRSTHYLADGDFFTALFAGEHNHRPYTEEGDEDADDGRDIQKFLKIPSNTSSVSVEDE